MIPLKRRGTICPDNPDRHWKILSAAIIVFFCIVYYDLLICKKTFIHDAQVWYGTFHYYLVNIQKGIFPYWDPYMLTGTYFYPNISGYGLLDPACLVGAFVSWLFSISPLTIFIYFRLYRIAVFVVGAFFLFRYLSRSAVGSVIAAGILLFAVMPQNITLPMMDYCFTTPLALYLVMLFIDNIHNRKRYLYLSCLTLITGITMNVFIPSAYLFNIVFFIFLLFVLKIRSLPEVAKNFLDKKLLIFTTICLILTVMMAAPPVSVKLKDASAGGELFPLGRMLDRTDQEFKKMMASEISNDIFSESFTEGASLFSWGAFIQLIYPDPGDKSFPLVGLYSGFYFGTIPLLLSIIGLAYARSPYKLLAFLMLLLNFINAFSFTGDGKYNFAQKFFHIIFPPLYMIDTRVNLGSLILLYICLCLSISLAFLLKKENLQTLLRTKFVRILALCIGIIGAKAVFIVFFAHNILFSSAYDSFIILSLGLFAMLIWAHKRGAVSQNALFICLLLMIFSDIGYYNISSTKAHNPDAAPFYNFLQTKESYRAFSIEESQRAQEGFEYFRLPFEGHSPFLSFGETLVETKGAFISKNSSTIFMTKRHYDLFAMLSPEKQFAVNGIFYPVVRFFPLDQAVEFNDKQTVLSAIEKTEPGTLKDSLFIEKIDRQINPFEVKDLREYEDVTWVWKRHLGPLYIKNIPFMARERMNLESFLTAQEYFVNVERFSINDIVIRVANNVDGYLYYGDGWSRYWQAFDGDRELPVWIANYNSKAVFLGKGEHRIRFVFNPKPYKIALILYYAGLLLSVVLIGYFIVLPSHAVHEVDDQKRAELC